MVSKFVDHTPLYRLSQISTRARASSLGAQPSRIWVSQGARDAPIGSAKPRFDPAGWRSCRTWCRSAGFKDKVRATDPQAKRGARVGAFCSQIPHADSVARVCSDKSGRDPGRSPLVKAGGPAVFFLRHARKSNRIKDLWRSPLTVSRGM